MLPACENTKNWNYRLYSKLELRILIVHNNFAAALKFNVI